MQSCKRADAAPEPGSPRHLDTVGGVARPRIKPNPPADAQAVLLASRALVGVAAQSLAQIEDVVTAMQWRVLVLVSRKPELSLQDLASALGVHPSTGTRLCDQLVAKQLVSRREQPTDRRYLILELTVDGQRIVDKVNADRLRHIENILSRMPESNRAILVTAMNDFAEAAGELIVDPLWDLTTESAPSRLSR